MHYSTPKRRRRSRTIERLRFEPEIRQYVVSGREIQIPSFPGNKQDHKISTIFHIHTTYDRTILRVVFAAHIRAPIISHARRTIKTGTSRLVSFISHMHGFLQPSALRAEAHYFQEPICILPCRSSQRKAHRTITKIPNSTNCAVKPLPSN